MSVYADQVTPNWQNYLDLAADVKPFLQMPPGAPSASDVQLQGVIDMACTWVQVYLGRPIAPTTIYRRFSGWSGMSGSYLSLPYYPVLQVVSLVETWGLNGQHTLVYQTPESQGASGQQMYQIDWVTGIIVRTFQGLIQRAFFPGTGNVECTWQAGYNPLPADIRHATLRLIKETWNAEQQASRSAPVPLGGQREDFPMTGPFGGIPADVERLLSPYLQQGIG